MTEKLINNFKDVTESLLLYDILAADGLIPVSELHLNVFYPISRSLQIYITVNTTDKGGRMLDVGRTRRPTSSLPARSLRARLCHSGLRPETH